MAKIRLFEPKDTEAVISVARKAWHYTYSKIFTEEKIEDFLATHYNQNTLVPGNSVTNAFWVAEENDRLVGFVQIGLLGEKMRLWRIYLDPDFIGKGVGAQFLETAERFMKANGIHTYQLEVHPKNKLGLDFYKRKGFAVVKSGGESCNSECEIIMEKEIK